MYFRSIYFGNFIDKGITQYHKTNYAHAMNSFKSAQRMNNKDFLLNFWMMRTAIKLGRLEEAQQYMLHCLNLRPDLEELILPSRQLIEYPEKYSIEEAEKAINELLQIYQTARQYSGKELLKILGIIIFSMLAIVLLLVLIIAFYKIKIHLNKDHPDLLMLVSYLSLTPAIYYYYSKPALTGNAWLRAMTAVRRIKNKEFLVFAAGNIIWNCVFGFIMYLGVVHANKVYQLGILTTGTVVMGVLIAPICEEAIFRGIIFNFVKKYNRLLAFWVSAILFYFFHGSEAASIQFFIAWFLAFAYVKFQTLYAPIILHAIHNATVSTIKILLSS